MSIATSDRPLGLGIVGAGYLSSARIYPCLHTLPVDLVAVCDLDAARAERNARRFGARRVHPDHRALLDDPEVEAVIVCVGAEAHAALAIDVLETGRPVYTEKPPAPSAAAARRVLEASRRSGATCMTGFKKRFAPAYRRARAALDDPAFGGLTLLAIHAASGATYGEDDASPAGFLLDFGIHAIDLVRFLGGEVDEVVCRAGPGNAYAASLRFRSGAVGSLALSGHRSWGVPAECVEVTGGPGEFLRVDDSTRLQRFRGDAVVERHAASYATMAADSLVETGFQPELLEFVTAARERRAPESSIESAYRTMCLYEAIARAARSGQPERPDHA